MSRSSGLTLDGDVLENEYSYRGGPTLQPYETYLLTLLGFCGFSVILALIYNAVRKHVYMDSENLDTSFDAGGRVTLSLTAVTVATQLLWPADLIQSSTVAAKNGLAGPFWYAVGVVTNILLFPILSIHFKTRAPGAKTYLQVIHARYGTAAHILYCCFALITNLVITTCLILAGRVTIQSVTHNASDEMVVFIMAAMFGSYSYVGGLGATFYVSYFNASLIFTMIITLFVNLFYLDLDFDTTKLGDMHKFYTSLSELPGPEDNEGASFLTFRSEGSLVFGIIGIFLASSVTFCDQASWQSRVAAKPMQGVIGFLLAAFIWYAIPSTLATATGLAYVALSEVQPDNTTVIGLLTDDAINAGQVTPFIIQWLMGKTGGIMVLSMVSMALMSTGSGEVMAVSSILVYDIYQKYIGPYRKFLPFGHCILCGMEKQETDVKGSNIYSNGMSTPSICSCVKLSKCEYCIKEGKERKCKYDKFACPTHGDYRNYQEMLINYKDWCIIWVSMLVIPLGLLVIESGINLDWAFTAGAVITIPFCPAVFLCIVWVKTTAKAVIIGGVLGVISGVAATLGRASTYEGGLYMFLENTGEYYSVLVGSCTSFGVSLIATIIVSLITHKIHTQADVDTEWHKTMSINNPLNPWQDNYKEEFGDISVLPTYTELMEKFKAAKYLAYIGGFIAMALLLFIVPGSMASLFVMDEWEVASWVRFCHVWTIIVAFFVIFVPPIQEIYVIVKRRREIKKYGALDEATLSSNESISPRSKESTRM